MSRNSLDSMRTDGTRTPAENSETEKLVSSRQAGDEAQLQAQVLRLVDHAEKQQAQLQLLLEEAQENRAQLTALLRQLTEGKPAPSEAALAELVANLSDHQEQLEALSGQLTKLNRTQFKANSLTETQGERLAQAIGILQEIIARREAAGQAAEARITERVREARAQATAELAVALLPVLDGLEAALGSGEALLKRRMARRAQVARELSKAPPDSLWARLRRSLARGEAAHLEEGVQAEEDERALIAWLDGLKLVHERLVKLLSVEHITPIEALGEPFDPCQHVAVEAAVQPEASPGTVVAVLRKGYRQRERVLRYAEVVVAQEESGSDKAEGANNDSDGG